MRHFNFYRCKKDRRAAQIWAKTKMAKCMICGSKRNLVVDHDNYTDLIRGVLCNSCNSGLGIFHDSPRKLRRAIRYLEIAALEAARWEVLECWLGTHLTKAQA